MALKRLLPVEPKAPVLIACWQGMGHVGILAASYLRQQLNGQVYAEIDASAYYQPAAIDVKDGIGRVPEPPAHRLYYVSEPAVIIFEAENQLPGQAGLKVASELLDAVKPAGVKVVYTGAAFAMPMSVRQESQVFGVATDERLRSTFASLNVEPLREGSISGLNGLLLGLAHSRGLPAACFLATMPQYAVETPNPKASKALVTVFQRILNTSVDMTEIDRQIEEADGLMGEFEERVATVIRQLQHKTEHRQQRAETKDEGAEEAAQEERPEPYQLMQYIEELFERAQQDRSAINLLKQELDRWGLFSLYEDRFLDLFDKTKKNK